MRPWSEQNARARLPIRTDGGALISTLQARSKGNINGRPLGIGGTFAGWHFKTCQFIAGDPREDSTKCGEPTVAGSSYCREHDDLCHVPYESPRGRRLWATTRLAANGAK